MNLFKSGRFVSFRDRLFAWPEYLIYIAGGLYQLGLVLYIFAGFDTAILRLVPDDTYYYLKIAENISKGLGSVFSVGAPTNGYHPLWMAILVVIHKLLNPSQEMFVLYALMAAVTLNVAAAAILRRLLCAFGFSDERARLGVVAYLFLPWFVNLTLTGLEIPLFYVCLFAFLLVTQTILRQPAMWTWRQTLGLGLAAGLVMLARTDAIFFTSCAFLLILAAGRLRALRPLLIAGIVASIVLSPWLLWNLVTFGTIEQSSSKAISAFVWYHLPSVFSRAYVSEVTTRFSFMTYWSVLSPFWPHRTYIWQFGGWHYILALGAAGILASLAYRRWRCQVLILPAALVIPVIALIVYYFGVRLFVQVWHLNSLFILALVFLLNFLPPLKLPSLGIVLVLSALVTAYTFSYCYFYPQQASMKTIDVARQLGRETGHPIRICHSDAGLYGYYNTNEVINLDGIVNNQALDAILAGRLSEYIARLDCDLVVLAPGRLDFYDRNMR